MGRWRAQGSNGDPEPHAGRGLLPPRRARGSGGDTTELPSEARKGFRGRERGMQPGRGGARGAWLPPHREGQSGAGTLASPHGRGRAASLQGERRMPTSPPAASPGAHPRPAHSGAQRILADGKEMNTATPPSMDLLRCVFHKLKARPPPAKGSGLASPQWSAPSPSHPGDARAAVVCVAQARATPCSSLASPFFFFLSITQLKEKALP